MKKKLPIFLIIPILIIFIFGWFITQTVQKQQEFKLKLEKERDSLSAELQDQTETDPSKVITFLEQTDQCPPIYPSSDSISKELIIKKLSQDQNTELLEFAKTLSDKDWPQIDFTPIPFFIYDDTFYLAKINYQNENDMKGLEKISPYLGQKILSCYFSDRNIPRIANLSIKPIELYIQDLTTKLEKEISEINEILQRTNLTDQYRSTLEANRDARINQLETANKQVGYFWRPNSIVLVSGEKYNANPDRFVATLLHEYVHFVSLDLDKRLERFWFDGLADYFTQKAMQAAGREYTGSYIEPIEIIVDMMKEIDENQFQNLLFSNDQLALEQLINSTYGANFYDQHRSIFLEIANSTATGSRDKTKSVLKDLETARNNN